MDNPWVRLPNRPRYVLPEDALAIDTFNSKATAPYQYDLTLLPEPYFGLPSAPIVLLALNPGRSEDDAAVHAWPAFIKAARQSLLHQSSDRPFLHLRDDLVTPGSSWWAKKIRSLVAEKIDVRTVAKNICCVQFFPYHSRVFRSLYGEVPSQRYSFDIVRQATKRGAEIVVMRSRKLWLAKLPELDGYPRLHRIRNPRNPVLSRRNLEDGSFDRLVDRLRSAY